MSRHLAQVRGRALEDEEFRTALLVSPREACESVGLPLDDEEYEAIARLGKDGLNNVIAQFRRNGGTVG